MNRQNSSEANLCSISAARIFLVSLLLTECDVVCVYLNDNSASSLSLEGLPKFLFFLKGTTKCKSIFSIYKTFFIYKNQSLVFSMPHADKQIEAEKYQLQTSLSVVVFVLGERDIKTGIPSHTVTVC
jgi:hypothetical protein